MRQKRELRADKLKERGKGLLEEQMVTGQMLDIKNN